MAKKVNYIIFDSNIIIDYLRGIQSAIDYFETIPKQDRAITSITYKEIIIGSRNKREQQMLVSFLREFAIFYITEDASKLSAKLIENYYRSHHLQIPDSLIGAICITNDLMLLTSNKKDFKFMPGIRLYVD
ncbi:MAG: type II toxin-antitoxin system VapC family toxin [Cytophagaceae bacterium]|jgi:hypothetical protein|nr:type II toxin-antitoxin system VapC family toxin [Cytophagaceae bacterium]